MPGFLLTLAEITLTMSAVILLLLALGPVLAKRYKIRWRYWAWLAVAVRLLIPSNFSLPNAPVVLTPPDPGPVLSAPQVSSVMDATPVPSHPLPSPTLSAAPLPSQSAPVDSDTVSPSPQVSPNSAVPSPQVSTVPDVPSFSLSLTAGQLLFCLWLTGAAGLTLWHLAAHWRFRRYLRRWAEPVEDTSALVQLEKQKTRLGLKASVSLSVCAGVDSPMLAGLFHPVILLPRFPGDLEELSLVLLHELCHLRRRDILYKALLYAAGAFHWFNPLVWMMIRQGVRDMELCCDDDVSTLLTDQERKHYAQTILNAIPRKRK